MSIETRAPRKTARLESLARDGIDFPPFSPPPAPRAATSRAWKLRCGPTACGARGELPEQQFNTWVRPLQAVEGRASALLAPNRFVVDWVNPNCAAGSASCCERAGAARRPPRWSSRSARGALAPARAAAAGRRGQPTPGPARGQARRDRRPAEPRFHLRELRRGQEQPARQGRGAAGRREPGQGLQPAVHLRRRRARQDPPDARGRPHHPRAQPGRAHRLRAFGALRRRHGEGAAAQHHERVQEGLPLARRAADRRHPVLRRQGALAGRVLPHLQRAARRPAAGDPHLRSLSEGGRGPRGAAEIALRLGPDGRDRAAGTRDLRRDPDQQGAGRGRRAARGSRVLHRQAHPLQRARARGRVAPRDRQFAASPASRSRWSSPRKRCGTCWRCRRGW